MLKPYLTRSDYLGQKYSGCRSSTGISMYGLVRASSGGVIIVCAEVDVKVLVARFIGANQPRLQEN